MTEDECLLQVKELAKIAELTPTDKSKVLFIGRTGGRFIDNVKYAFLEACRNNYGFSPLFLTTFKEEYSLLTAAGLPVVLFPDAIRQIAECGTVVCDDFWWKNSIIYPLVHRAKTLQLWHGIPLKSIGKTEIASSVNMNEEKKLSLDFAYSGYDTVLSTSRYVSENIFTRVFDCQNFLDAGYPRNDILLRRPDKLDFLNTPLEDYGQIRAHKRGGGKVIFYMPTFRDTGGDPFSDEAIKPVRMNEFCKQHNILFMVKLHPYVNFVANGNLTNFVHIPASEDAYPMLAQADVLLTDYSSVYFDFLLCNRPIHFYIYDVEKYTSTDREFMLDFASVTPGSKSFTQNELFACLKEIVVDERDDFGPQRQKLQKQLFDHSDSGSAGRVCKYIKDAFC